MFFAPADVTPISNPPIDWVEIRPGSNSGSEKRQQERLSSARNRKDVGEYAVYITGSTGVFASRTTGHDLISFGMGRGNQVIEADPVSEQVSRADAIARERIALLAAKYAASKDRNELIARLEILNEKLLSVAPRVTRDRVEALERISDSIGDAQSSRLEIMKRFNISL